MSSLRGLSKRYGPQLDRLPFYIRKRINKMMVESHPPALQGDRRPVREDRKYTKPEQWKVAVGDQVMLTKGDTKGTVTKVLGLSTETNTVFLEMSNKTRQIVVPKQFWQPGQSSHIIKMPVSVHPNDLKVVGTMVEEAEDGTEVEKLIAADEVVFKGQYWDEDYGKMMPYRRIKNMEHVIIPWPRPAETKDDKWCTSAELADERTYSPQCLVRTDSPAGIVESMRDPIMKRPYKWGKDRLTKSEAKRLEPAPAIYSDTKKKMFAERAQIRQSLAREPSSELVQLIGERVAGKLNSVEDRDFAYWVKSVSPLARSEKREKAEKKKALEAEKLRERQVLKKVTDSVVEKYRKR